MLALVNKWSDHSCSIVESRSTGEDKNMACKHAASFASKSSLLVVWLLIGEYRFHTSTTLTYSGYEGTPKMVPVAQDVMQIDPYCMSTSSK